MSLPVSCPRSVLACSVPLRSPSVAVRVGGGYKLISCSPRGSRPGRRTIVVLHGVRARSFPLPWTRLSDFARGTRAMLLPNAPPRAWPGF
eukprot:3066201-Prymnesium_polylepis.2